MHKTILITGSTDGIGFEAAKTLVADGHHVLLHGRNEKKLADVFATLSNSSAAGRIESFVADLSRLGDVETLVTSVTDRHEKVDVLINNAGIYKTPETINANGLDVRFVVNTIAPYLLTTRLLPLFDATGRIVNLSSAAQAPVDLLALAGETRLADMDAYAQSKLAITMWTNAMSATRQGKEPSVIAVNPGSLLATKMVKEGFGVAGNDVRIGADVIVRAAVGEDFSAASGKYFDNDTGAFADPHPDALDPEKCAELVAAVEQILAKAS